MVLTQKEEAALKDLQTQEQSCIEKYTRYAGEANDPQLQNIFKQLSSYEQEHYNSLSQALTGNVPDVDCNDSKGCDYKPTATYKANENTPEKQNDCFLVTDCIGTEKLVSGEYNNDVFIFGDTKIRKLLADIQIEEQNHAEMLWKYKTTNHMS
ncbi:MAG: ferritin-like domain-containing protein [Lachnospiraceae bacterium]|nr:ferritin-like domain-containing protein [Lachnospiraceae bacterium]